jgi:hypothetical protein
MVSHYPSYSREEHLEAAAAQRRQMELALRHAMAIWMTGAIW